MGRLAVDQRFQGKGLGELLLVDAIDEQAAGYYLRFGFLAIPDNPLLLFYPASRAES